MKKWILICLLPTLSFAQINPFINSHHFTTTLRLAPNQPTICQLHFHNEQLKAHLTYSFNPKTLIGLGAARIENKMSNIAPIDATLYQLGDSDRLAYAHYYNPYRPLQLGTQHVYIYSILLNICSKMHSRQAAIQIDFEQKSQGPSCLLTTAEWNYCR